MRELLDRGFAVRGTLRDATDERKTTHLRRLAAGREDRLELHSADLLEDGSFDDAVAGCDVVIHAASPVYLVARDPVKEIIEPAVRGTENVFAAVARAGTVRAVGLTSSIAAIAPTDATPGRVLSEADWVEDATPATNPYGLSKRRAEKAAWAARDRLPAVDRYDLVVVNPVMVFGPVYARVHVRSSTSAVRSLMRGSFRGCPRLGFGAVDVREVVTALIDGVEAGDRTGRYILCNRFVWMQEIARIIAAAYPERRVPTRRLPNLIVYLAALFDRRLSLAFVRRNLGRQDRIDASRSVERLGVRYRPIEETIRDTCESLIEHDLV